MNVRTAMVAVVGAAVAHMCALPSVEAQPVPLDPVIALDDARAAYTAAPWCERAVVSVRRVMGGLAAELAAAAEADAAGLGALAGLPAARDRAERRAELVVCWEPEAEGGGRGWMELGELRVVIERGVLTAVHARNGLAYVQEQLAAEGEPVTAAALGRVLPPVPLPGVDVALAGERPLRGITAYVPEVQWLSAVVDDASDPRRVALTGRGGHGLVSMTLEAATGRIVEFACDASPPDAAGQQTVIVVRTQALAPARRPEWMREPPAVEGRERVASLRQLAPVRPTELRPGQTVAGLPLLTREGTPWSPAADLGAGGIGGLPGETLLVLLFVRVGEDLGAYRDAAEAVRAWAEGLEGVRVSYRPVLVVDLADREADRRVQEAAGVLGDRLLWTASGPATIDRFAPAGSKAAVAVLDGQRTLVRSGAVEGVDGVRAFLDGVMREQEAEER